MWEDNIKLDLKSKEETVLAVFIWFREGYCGGILRTPDLNFGF